jgi:hypothetical protein
MKARRTIDFDQLERLAAAGATAPVIIEVLRTQEGKKATKKPRQRKPTPTNTNQHEAAATNTNQPEPTPSKIAERASPDFVAFWQKFPNKVGREAALKAFERTMKSGVVTLEFLLSALDRYCKKTDDRQWCNPATWLNQHRWNDQPAQVIPNGKLTVHQAAANLTARVRALDEPAPSDLCDRAGGGVVRRIPPR